MPNALYVGQRKARAPFGGGLGLEAHHADEQEVKDRREDDRTEDCFGIVRHMSFSVVVFCVLTLCTACVIIHVVLQKEPGHCHCPGFT